MRWPTETDDAIREALAGGLRFSDAFRKLRAGTLPGLSGPVLTPNRTFAYKWSRAKREQAHARNGGYDGPTILHLVALDIARRDQGITEDDPRRLAAEFGWDEELGIEPISEKVTPHSLRRTYASVRAAAGDDPVYIAEQLGHADMALTFRVYQKAVKRRVKLSGAHLREFDRALEWAMLAETASDDRHPIKAANRQREPIPGNGSAPTSHESPARHA